MKDADRRRVEIAAPAKLNLGLEVIGRRGDGFHELATNFLAIDLCDRVALSEAEEISLVCDDPALTGGDNLAVRALTALRDETGDSGGARIELHKQIPAAAGLGGASSDAAAALLAARELWRLEIGDQRLAAIAAGIGSDVPFFLRGGCALGRGRGEVLIRLPNPAQIWFVLVVPDIRIEQKTARLFASLRPGDFSDGARVAAQAERLRAGDSLDASLLGNAFTRALYARVPDLAKMPGVMREAGASIVAISGAGPAHYAPVGDPEESEGIAARLRAVLGAGARVFVAAPVPPRLTSSG